MHPQKPAHAGFFSALCDGIERIGTFLQLRSGLYFFETYPPQSRRFCLHIYWDVHHECFYVCRFRCRLPGHRSFCHFYACCCRLLHFLLRRVCSQGFPHPSTSSCSSLAFWLCPRMIRYLPAMNDFVRFLDVSSINPKVSIRADFSLFGSAVSEFFALRTSPASLGNPAVT